MGGIPTDTDGRVVSGEAEEPVPGLYAAGECACVSVHGANRLGTNSLLDIVVFGRRGGRHAAAYAADSGLPDLPDRPERATEESLRGLLGSSGTVRMADVRAELQEQMMDLAGVVRTEDGLRKMQDLLGGLRERYGRAFVEDKGKVYNTDVMEAWELGALLDCADTLVAAALARDESRGGHFRDDHQLRDDDTWLRHSLAYRDEGGGVRLEYKPVKLGTYVPMERKY
jgi:succinate dehydrogenase / fumarate reductase flavoprotein subunit